MAEEQKREREKQVSRREFIRDAGAVLTGTALGSVLAVPREVVEAATPKVITDSSQNFRTLLWL